MAEAAAVYIEELFKTGYHEVSFRVWRAGAAWDGGTVPDTTVYCRAWKPGTTAIKSGKGPTAGLALRACWQDTGSCLDSASDAQYPHQTGRPLEPEPALAYIEKQFTDTIRSAANTSSPQPARDAYLDGIEARAKPILPPAATVVVRTRAGEANDF